jgi:hypothetical protein
MTHSADWNECSLEQYVMKLRGTATEKLADVIQMLQLVHRTGVLRVQRSTIDNFVEEGAISFQDGQVLDASVGPLQGSDAFKKLLLWTTCHFVFESASPTSSSTGPLPVPSAGTRRTTGALAPEARELPAPYAAIPYRLWQIQEALPDFQRLGLSRVHRQLFMLVDGRRSVYELMTLIRRHPQEVFALLADLERAGLIRQA